MPKLMLNKTNKNKEVAMIKKVSVILFVVMVAIFSTQSVSAAPKLGKPPVVEMGDIAKEWNVTVKELLIIGGIGTKKATNVGTITFTDGEPYDSFVFDNPDPDGIIPGFLADCSIQKKGAKINWSINDQDPLDPFDAKIEAAINSWVEEWAYNNSKTLAPVDPVVVNIDTYAYKPIVVIKNAASPKLGILQVRGTVAITTVEVEGPITEFKNFKYQNNFKFHPASVEPVVEESPAE
jgi:hypothetical protein